METQMVRCKGIGISIMETIQGSEPQMRVPGVPYPVTVLGYPATLIDPQATYDNVSEQIGGIALKHPRKRLWLGAFAFAFTLFLVFGLAVSYLLYRGVGIW